MTVGSDLLRSLLGVCVVPVSDESLETSDSYRLEFDAECALALALCFLWADTSADCWERRGLVDDLVCTLDVILLQAADEVWDCDVDRAALDTWPVLAVQASLCLCDCDLVCVSESDLIEVVGTDLWVLDRHFMFLWIKWHFVLPPQAFLKRLQVSSWAFLSNGKYILARDIASSKSTS